MAVDCLEMFAGLSEYLDGELPPNLCQELARHLEGCTACDAFRRTLRLTVELCRQLPPKPVPEDLPRKLHALLIRELGA